MSMTYNPKSSKQLFRDCLRLIKHIAGASSPKALHLRKVVAAQFREHKDVVDPAKLHQLKQAAERGLSNYLLFERAKQDPKIAAAAAKLDAFEDDASGRLVRVMTATPNTSSKPAPVATKERRKRAAVASTDAAPTSTVSASVPVQPPITDAAASSALR